MDDYDLDVNYNEEYPVTSIERKEAKKFLENIIVIDDESSYYRPEQVKNVLPCRWFNITSNFDQMNNIFKIVGMLNIIFNKLKTDSNATLSDITYQVLENILDKKELQYLYDLGLKELQCIVPSLDFFKYGKWYTYPHILKDEEDKTPEYYSTLL